MPEFTFRELQECAAREVKQRERVYPRLIEQRKLTASFAQRQIDMMKAISDELDSLADEQEAEGRLI